MNKIKSLGILSLSALLMTACGGSNDSQDTAASELPDLGDRYELDENTPAWKLDTKEETTKLTWFIENDGFNDNPWGEDIVTKKIGEDLNIEIEIIPGDEQALNTYVASGQMPDIVSLYDGGKSNISQKAAEWALPLNVLADKYDPYFYEVTSDDTLNWYKLEDGNTYGYASFSNTEEDLKSGAIPSHNAFVVRDDVLAALPNLDFTTPEGFKDAMDQIHEKFPELTPLGFGEMKDHLGALGGTLQDFIGVPWVDENNEYYDRNMDEEYLTWINVLREVHSKGYISDDTFADDYDTVLDKIKNGEYAAMLVAGTHAYQPSFQGLMDSKPEAAYSPVDAFQSDKYDGPAMSQGGLSGYTTTYISKDNTDPIKSIQFFTYMISEDGQIAVNFGTEGESYYEGEDGYYHLTEEYQDWKDSDIAAFKEETRISEIPFFGHDNGNAQDYIDPDDIGWAPAVLRFQEWGKGKLVPKFEVDGIDPEYGTQEARSLVSINDEFTTAIISGVRSDSEEEFDTIISDFKTFRENQGWDNIVEVFNENIQENINKLKD
ncbi:hypothetical protein BW727_101957 [Jeotgalibaca dankookensis]|uniref:Lipoprotein LipO n=1 Tax=Jeotgalibaca dankookensis TaxID=708126 RepID=A0A1S6IRV3_9LACT|nr:hypothetical protein [Jeotgalibaca dankookensis]AQS54281.1 hypothetical protein BW727_101957 [Jeotgalibaca dankookensis]